jgi:squalene-hopene/tetraprenyl-beta-curcumene cyclase
MRLFSLIARFGAPLSEGPRQRAPHWPADLPPHLPVADVVVAVERAAAWLLERQHEDGYWVAELEADVSITAEYLLLGHFIGRVRHIQERKAARFILDRQGADGGWPIYHGGPSNVSATAKAYLALRAAGYPAEDRTLRDARTLVLDMGGLPAVNTFTKTQFALVGQFDWQSVPAIPVEIALLSRWAGFHLGAISYWSRATLVPLSILASRRAVRRLAGDAGRGELVRAAADEAPPLPRLSAPILSWRNLFLLVERGIKRYERSGGGRLRARATEAALDWMAPRMGEGGLGAIYPAMAGAVMALHHLGRPLDDPLLARALAALDDLVIEDATRARVQPCRSPVWDTAVAMNALGAAGLAPAHPALVRGAAWLASKEVRRRGDWADRARPVEPSGWAFQFENEWYPDVDDTAAALLAMTRAATPATPAEALAVRRGVEWLLAMQSSNGGWGAFDVDNDRLVLNHIPFADHGALLDPPTADLTGRCLEVLGHLGYDRRFGPAARGIAFLRREQEPDGSWYGRWGVNYLYGTWSVLAGLAAIGEPMDQPYVQQAVQWLVARQHADGGWGESCASYEAGKPEAVRDVLSHQATTGPSQFAGAASAQAQLCTVSSTPSQTAWALLGLLHAGAVRHPAVARGVDYLVATQRADGTWDEDAFTGTGFPRVFYLRYHLYRHTFPLWALGLYVAAMRNAR